MAVRDAIVGEINRSVGNRKRLQHVGNAIEAGVEDAIVEAFNYSANNNLSAIPKTPQAPTNACASMSLADASLLTKKSYHSPPTAVIN